MKKIFYSSILLLTISFTSNAQLKNSKHWQNDNLQQTFLKQLRKNSTQHYGFIKINPYWQDVNAPHTYNSFIPNVKVPTFNAVWAKVGYDSTGIDSKNFLRTADYGKTWRYDTITAPQGYLISSLAPIDGNICYAAVYNDILGYGAGGGVFKTINGGITWRQLEPGKLFDSTTSVPQLVYFFDALHGFVIGNGNGPGTPYFEIYTTSDAGITWKRVPRENIPAVNGVPFVNDFAGLWVAGTRIWFQGFDTNGGAAIYRSDDFGHHWQVFPFTLSNSYNQFAFADKLNGLAVGFGDNGPIEAISHDGGATWSEMSFTGILPGVFVTAVPGTHIFVSTAGGSSYSKDYGKSWVVIDSGANVEHTAVAFLNPVIGWTGSGGSSDPEGGMYKLKYSLSLKDDAIAEEDKAVAITDDATASTKNNTTGLSAYPNPVTNAATISFNLQQSQKVTVAIYDMNGRLVKTLANQQMQQGAHQLTWNARNEQGSSVIAGMYLLKLNAGDYVETKKISVIR